MMNHHKENNKSNNQQTRESLQQHLQQLLAKLQLEDAPAGGAVVVYQAGKCIAQASIGLARPDMPWQPDTLAINFSTGKGVLATLVHVLISSQLLDYDTPIASYWPAFAAQDKGSITLRCIMSHQADLFSIQSINPDVLHDWHAMLDEVAAMPITPPDAAALYDSAYSALVYGWVLGGVIEAVTDMSLATALRHYLTEPLGIADSCYFGVPDSKLDYVATLTKHFEATEDSRSQLHHKRQKPTLKVDAQNTLDTYASLPSYGCWQQMHHNNKPIDSAQNLPVSDTAQLDTARINRLYFDTSMLNLKNYKAALIPDGKQPIDYHSRETLQSIIPAANGVASAQALATIYAMLACGGIWQGQTLIEPATFEQLATPHVTGRDAVMPAKMGWRLGYHRLFSLCSDACVHSHDSNNNNNNNNHNRSHQTADVAASGFGHMGYNGSVAWCDPARQLSFAFVHNFDTTMLNDVRQFALTEALIKMIDADGFGL